jgi:hypothetical protein
MKSKTKTILIFAAILAAVFLVAFLDGSAVQSDAAEEAGVLIGAYVSEEDLDLDDLIVTATGKFQWKSGRIYAEQTGKSWYFPTLDDGGGIFCAQISEEGTDYPTVVHFGGLGKARSRVNVSDADGIRTTDIDLSGEVYACGDEHRIFNFYPIYQTPDGRVYLTSGSSIGVSGDDGGSVSHTLTSDKTESIGGKSERVKVKVAITAVSHPTPTKFTVAHMDENDTVLKLEEFAPDALPESITPADGAAYLIGTSCGFDRDGETAEYDICSRGDDGGLHTFRYRDGSLTAVEIRVDWKGETA